jgi:hypothetical protein
MLLANGCSRDYKEGLIGKWDAGSATGTSRIQVEFDRNGVITAAITNSEIAPARGTYKVVDDQLTITLARIDIPYTIKKMRGGTVVLGTRNGTIKWRKVE